MMYRKIVSLSLLFGFSVVLITGVVSYLTDYTKTVATIHTIFGFGLGLGIILHVCNNYIPLKRYSNGSSIIIVSIIGVLTLFGTYYQLEIFEIVMNYGSRSKAKTVKEVDSSTYNYLEMNMDKNVVLNIDLLRGKHYWHPQMAIWIEDVNGEYVETIFISKATAKGIFFGGRSKENFKSFDASTDAEGDYRRVDALPVWSHKRGIKYEDAMYVPTHKNPMPDAITGATFIDNFKLLSSTNQVSKFNLFMELNVAFDDNEYYSEFDFPEDDVFHNGTGQLGQPSIIYTTMVDMIDGKDYYLMELIGHGHRSGQDGVINRDMTKLTTAHDIVERIILNVKKNN